MSRQLMVLSGGAAQGLVGDLAPRFKGETSCEIAATFGAVGAMRDKLLAGAPADLLILTRALIDALAVQGHVVPGSAVDIGTVATAIAVRSGDLAPAVDAPAQLSAALLAADEVYLPDPTQATAGIHFAGVLDRLGIAAAVASRLRPFPNGTTAMRALAASTGARPLGCTQVTEIVATPGVRLVAPLPDPLGLATLYTAAVATCAALPDGERDAAAGRAGIMAAAGWAPDVVAGGYNALVVLQRAFQHPGLLQLHVLVIGQHGAGCESDERRHQAGRFVLHQNLSFRRPQSASAPTAAPRRRHSVRQGPTGRRDWWRLA